VDEIGYIWLWFLLVLGMRPNISFLSTFSLSLAHFFSSGVVCSTKMERTLTFRRDYLHFIKKYKRFEKRHKKVSAHVSPAFVVKEGDIVTVGQCR
jgi:small subunit ribosomal protein S11e